MKKKKIVTKLKKTAKELVKAKAKLAGLKTELKQSKNIPALTEAVDVSTPRSSEKTVKSAAKPAVTKKVVTPKTPAAKKSATGRIVSKES